MVRRRAMTAMSDGTSVQEPHTKSYGYMYIHIHIHIYIYTYTYIYTYVYIYIYYTYGNTTGFFSIGNDPQMVDFPLIKLFFTSPKVVTLSVGE